MNSVISRRHRAAPDPAASLWYKDAIVYQLHVRAFSDSDGDGIGDFVGLTSKLDYLQDLGVTALWLLPFYPSPLRDGGYDIADYTSVHPSYGTLADFKVFLREAHHRGLRVITELVINHTSDQHPWFQRARRARPDSPYRDFYVWSEHPDKYLDARIIFKDFETSNWAWDAVAQAYYWHRFYAHQPDLNFDNPRVRKAVFKVLDFWLDLGVDGLRLDAVPYLFEREGTNCENLPETHVFLRELRAHVDRHYPNRMLLAEANQWPEDSVAYFGAGDECHMNFHFPVMPRMFMALQMEDRFPLIDILRQTPPIPESAQWAVFLRNHDELTLEMVTDEERDYMYRMYAHESQARINLGIRRRLAPLLGNNRRKIELLNGLLFSLPGTPILYYGDEIGLGDNIYLGDRNGVRTPMQWSPDRNAGFSTANPQKLYLPLIIDPEFNYEAINVESQQRNPQSVLWWMKRLIAHRRRHAAFGRGSLQFVYPENSKVLAFLRSTAEETILIVANLSRYVQYAELDLSAYRGRVPVEVFGLSAFPAIGDRPYPLTLGPHNFYWFNLTLERPADGRAGSRPALEAESDWRTLFARENRGSLESLLPNYLRERRWFAGKAKKLRFASVTEFIPIGNGAAIVFTRVEYTDADPETYQLALAFVSGDKARRLAESNPGAVVAALTVNGRGLRTEGLLIEATADPDFNRQLLTALERRRTFRGQAGELTISTEPTFRQLRGAPGRTLDPVLLSAEQSNTSIVFGNQLILKLIRRVEAGENPELELGRYLEGCAVSVSVPPVAGAFEYRHGREAPTTLAIVEGYVRNEGTAWSLTLDSLGRFFEKALAYQAAGNAPPAALELTAALTAPEIPLLAQELLETYLDSADLLGKRTAQFHSALGAGGGRPGFEPEAFSTLYQRSLYQSMRSQTAKAMGLLQRQLRSLNAEDRAAGERLIAAEPAIEQRFAALLARKYDAVRIRCHGDFHLGQVLHTGKDFVLIDFEGEPMLPLSERRIKRSPLRDVAGMLRSFQYASATVARRSPDRNLAPEAAGSSADHWGRFWTAWASAAFWRAYRTAATPGLTPASLDDTLALLHAYLLDKALYELVYELNHRPAWVGIPLAGILQLTEHA